MNERLKHYNEKMEKTIRVLENEYSAIRAGRANPAVLDKITVRLLWDAYPDSGDGCDFRIRSAHSCHPAMG